MGELSAERLSKHLAFAREVYVSGCAAEIAGLPDMFDKIGLAARITGIFSPLINARSYANEATGRRCRTFFLNRALRRDIAAGLVDFCPWTYSQISHWCCEPDRFDTAIVMVAPPDENGLCSFGTQVDFLPDFYHQVKTLIGVINPNMPRTLGTAGIPLDVFSAVYGLDTPIAQHLMEGSPTAEQQTIAHHVSSLVPDEATVQLGMGRIPQAITATLKGHRSLRFHAGLVDDSIMALEDAGALDCDMPVVSGSAMGSRALYDRIHRNPRFDFRPASYSHAAAIMARKDNFIAINGAVQVDLLGQVNSESAAGRVLATPGGLPDFLKGAGQSKGGLRIFALPSRGGRHGESSIVSVMGSPFSVTVPRTEVDIVVTEYGIADLRMLTIDRRAEALVAVAHPDDRSRLTDDWVRMRGGAFA